MTKPILHLRSLSATLLVLLFAGHPVLADDTEVLIGSGNQANVLFIMDTSGSMRNNIAGSTPATGESSRLQIVQGVFADLMRNPVYQGFNVALMRFDSGGHGGYFVTPMQQLNTSTQDSIITASNNLAPGGDTPLSETLYEAARYWGGMTVDYGDSSNPDINDSAVMDADATLSSYVANSAHYISPITSQCQKNYTILLTDGSPNGDAEANNSVRNDLLGGTACSGGGNGGCLDDIAGYLYTTDLSTGANGLTGRQYAETYTIGFTTNQALLEATAMAGGGTARANGVGNDHYFTASSATALASAFADALAGITASEGSFSPPALAADAFNGISHNNRLYFALFKPDTAPKWDGNVKPYELNDSYQLVDAGGGDVIDGNGAFVASSRSFWANSADGGSIAEGGANGRLPTANNRNLYTYTGDYNLAGLVPDSPTLSASSNIFDDTNSDLTSALLELPTSLSAANAATARTTILNATRASRTIGAPLHSQPTLVTYGGTDAASADLTLFVATNDGFLHALDASPAAEPTTDGGKELFAFIPKELLPNLQTLTNRGGTHPYGLDGDISVWVKEDPSDSDVIIDTSAASSDHVYVYVGMRRGGNNYYALDVTDRTDPTLKWVIRGGANGTPGFEELGQSWSKPTLTTIKYGASTRKVLIFGGGYDTAQDLNPRNTDDSIGRAIYVVDADTGQRLWWAGPAGCVGCYQIPSTPLTNSIPSDVRLLDSNLDGNTDRLYVGDMRGQIFRIDLQATTTGVTGSGVRLANLGGTNESDNRRFFYPPDVVMTQHHGTAPYISVNIGSGYRAHPLNPLNADGTAAPRVNDRFYSLRDHSVIGAATTTNIVNDDLFPATSTAVLSSQQTVDLSSSTASGWFITLGAGNGEKVLAPSITLDGEIFFTTYTPPASTTNVNCEPPSGSGRLYRVNLFDATPVTPQAGANTGSTASTPTTADRVTNLERPGIPPAPTAMFRKTTGGVEVILCVGTECDELSNAIHMQETYWTDGS